MAATATKVGDMGYMAGVGAFQQYTILLDTSFAAGGEAIDLTADFSQFSFAVCGANNADADNRYLFKSVHPGLGTAATSSNFLISASQSNSSEAPLDEANTVDLSSVGELNLLVIGLPAVQTSWA